MRVVPTLFSGITFRSRTEARWAVVFEALGWRYDYEPEGFILPSGRYYPDFYLPNIKAFFEVKGQTPTDLELRKAEELCVATENIVVVSHGPPNPQRNEWDRDLSTFCPERDLGDKPFADCHQGGFVGGRLIDHPKCSIDLGNLVYLPGLTELGWEDAFRRAVNHRFDLFPQQ